MQSPADCTGPVNLGNPREFSMRELAQLIIEATGSRSKMVFLPLPQDDPRQRQPDVSLAKQHLGWSPTVQLSDGLQHTVAYFDGLLSQGARTGAT
jgi:UDP-glucuronate decarboxylase